MSNIQKLLKKTEKDKGQKKDDKKQEGQKQKKKEDEDDEMGLDLQIENNDTAKQTKQKIAITKFVQQEIEQPVVKEVKKVEPVRTSWVPQQGGVVQTFDLEKEKDHFVGIGEEYKPPPEKTGMANLKPLEYTDQEKKQMGQEAMSNAVKPMFTNKKKQAEGPVQIQKTAQQLKEQQMEELINANKARTMTKEEKEQKEAERKKREEEGMATLGLNNGQNIERKPMFTKSTQESTQAPFRPLEKTQQQIKQQEIEARAKQAGLMGKTLTKQQAQAKKQRSLQLQAKRRQDQQLIRQQMKPADQPQGPPRFTNSKKKTEEPTFTELKE